MLIRIVKLNFNQEDVDVFLDIFNNTKNEIRNFEGCRLLELYRDRENKNTFFSYSFWESEAALNRYRNSEFFKQVWEKTKLLFNEKPVAWSVDKIESLH